jgi:hypothetical protein
MNTEGVNWTKDSQCDAIIAALREGGSLTAINALLKFGCFNMKGRIHDLRALGWDIKTEMITTSTGKRVALYTLRDPNQPPPEPSVKLRRKTLADIERQIEKMPGGVDFKAGARWVIKQIQNK